MKQTATYNAIISLLNSPTLIKLANTLHSKCSIFSNPSSISTKTNNLKQTANYNQIITSNTKFTKFDQSSKHPITQNSAFSTTHDQFQLHLKKSNNPNSLQKLMNKKQNWKLKKRETQNLIRRNSNVVVPKKATWRWCNDGRSIDQSRRHQRWVSISTDAMKIRRKITPEIWWRRKFTNDNTS